MRDKHDARVLHLPETAVLCGARPSVDGAVTEECGYEAVLGCLARPQRGGCADHQHVAASKHVTHTHTYQEVDQHTIFVVARLVKWKAR